MAPAAVLAVSWLASAVALVAAAEVTPTYTPTAVIWGGVAALPLVVGLVQVAKRSGLEDRWAGLLAVLLGLGGGLLFGMAATVPLVPAAVQGLMVGLAAAGAWSTGKSAGLGR